MGKLVRTPIAVTAQGAGTVNGSGVPVPRDAVEVQVVVTVNAGSPTVDVTLEWSNDGGGTWSEPETPDAFTQITATGSVVGRYTAKGGQMRPVAAVAGTTPDVDISVHVATEEAAR